MSARKLSAVELLLARVKRAAAFPRPAWGDHVLDGKEGRTTAKPHVTPNVWRTVSA